MDQQAILNAIDALNRVTSNPKTSEKVRDEALAKISKLITKLEV